MAYQIIIADDHPLFRAALRQAVNQAVEDVAIHEVDTIAALQDAVESNSDLDLVLLDLKMPGAHGFSGLAFMRGQYPGLPVVMVSGSEELPVIRKALDYGASGFIPKSSSLPAITSAIQVVLNGEIWLPDDVKSKVAQMESAPTDFSEKLATLTPQQFRVLGMLTEGMLNKQIAYDLDVSEATVKAHITALFRKLGVRNRTQAVIAVQQLEVDNPGSSDLA
ncbi:MAG: response regulator transcription factor [Pseudomonadales bacterium]|uniref:Two component LuxR family transcriptional regulator n=1 Tax=Oleiphilus messinensis TaxID=141451 RepID=A0A1Y0IFW4_9GAMM|nr:response regulator transcription factor [Oleiphilus messinensis]ARU58395.1 two component LuxR family transcriptional regulator [Oleiphilus messinensis]MCG8613722.1 response regulator transcription factor [Pseudomonadales bacterium]